MHYSTIKKLNIKHRTLMWSDISKRQLVTSTFFSFHFFPQLKINVPLYKVLNHLAVRGFANNSKPVRTGCKGQNARLIKTDINFHEVPNILSNKILLTQITSTY